MIEKIVIRNEGSYQGEDQTMDGLKKVNFIYGPNGSGKTTISRILASQTDQGVSVSDNTVVDFGEISETSIEPIGSHCTVKWHQNHPSEILVYNRDFVAKHFSPNTEVRGIYTFGDNVDVGEEIEEKTNTIKKLSDEIRNLRNTLNGDDGNGGKQKEKDDLDVDFLEMCWKAKKPFDKFKEAFKGAGTKENCKSRYEKETTDNSAVLLSIEEINEKAKLVFSDDLAKEEIIPPLQVEELVELERSPILSKIVLGKEDVDIAAMITKLGNSDWVQSGITFYSDNDEICPFCQQETTQDFRKSLSEYFDESYTQDIKTIEKLHADYQQISTQIQGRIESITLSEPKFLDKERIKEKRQRLDALLSTNLARIEGKNKEPSSNIALETLADVLLDISDEIEAANKKAKANNDTVANLAAQKRELISQIWKRLLEDSKVAAQGIIKKRTGVQAAITGINSSIEKKEKETGEISREIEDLERKITSIKPTLEDINKLLLSFGFSNFSLTESDTSGFYKIVRADGSDAKETLSEGEKSFITFLYFYQLIKGSFKTSGSTTHRVVVFDDPVSSLDSDVLFIVCNLIKGVVNEIRGENSSLAQIIVLTHNVYFHKEISFEGHQQKKKDVPTFWTIKKKNGESKIERHDVNPVTSSYEMLWEEIRNPDRSISTAQNVMRRIIEHYFTFLGGIKTDEIVGKFTGKDRMLCGSLFSWINDGSHYANDDLYIACDASMVEKYLVVFKRIFEEMGHITHYDMMTKGVDIVPVNVDKIAEGDLPVAAGGI